MSRAGVIGNVPLASRLRSVAGCKVRITKSSPAIATHNRWNRRREMNRRPTMDEVVTDGPGHDPEFRYRWKIMTQVRYEQ